MNTRKFLMAVSMAILMATIIGAAKGSPPVSAQGLVAVATPRHTYRVVSIQTRDFYPAPLLPWLHLISCPSATVVGSPGSPPPSLLRISDWWYFSIYLPLHVRPIGRDTWQVSAPSVLAPNLLPGPVGLQFFDFSGLTRSGRTIGYLH